MWRQESSRKAVAEGRYVEAENGHLQQTRSFLQRNGNGTGRTSYNGDHAWRGDAV